ncbi:MAG TPA: DUF2071 domain-containing protein [Terriglobales bacterium]|nr:DUF2071 domain-containing protein [Terriglobales bacterium]
MTRSPDSHPVLSITSHRPWPLPKLPWVMVQRWHDLLFAHWALPPEKIRPLIARELEIDTYEDKAWVGVIPFWMSGVRFRALPPIPGASRFPELNVRTYVRAPGQSDKPGVYFFSLDAASVLAALGARAGTGLPYFWANMQVEISAINQVGYRSIRRQRPRGAELRASYRPTGPASQHKNDFERFVTERYCLYVVRSGIIHRIQIHHLPWPLQPAEAEFEKNSMAAVNGIELPPEKPVLQFAKFLEVYIFSAERIE